MTDLPEVFKRHPRLSDWLSITAGEVLVKTGKVDIGQGISTAIAMIVAEELDIPVTRIRVQTATTADGPNEFITAGSQSIEGSGMALRRAAADARFEMIQVAAARLGQVAGELQVGNGEIAAPGSNQALPYHDLWDEVAGREVSGQGLIKAPASHQVVGRSVPRLDLRGKITGQPAFIQDAAGVCHGRVLRPPHHQVVALASINREAALAVSGVLDVVVDGSFVGIVAETPAALDTAALRLAPTWVAGDRLDHATGDYLRNNQTHALRVVAGTPQPDAEVMPDSVSQRQVTASYFKPYHLHASMAPSAAIAEYDGQTLSIETHSQGPHLLCYTIGSALGLAPDAINVRHRENAGCYGHNGADDAAMDAALLAWHCPGRRILLRWTRAQEHAHEPCSPAMAVDLGADLANGRITGWSADIYSETHVSRPVPGRDGTTTLRAAEEKSPPLPRREARPGLAPHGGIHRNADPYYEFPDRHIVKRLVAQSRVRTSAMRGLGATANVFAIESFMDELASTAAVDPIAFRLAHTSDARAARVIETAASLMAEHGMAARPGWRAGRGFAFARYKNEKTYAAVGVALRVCEETFAIELDHAVIAADAGQVIDADGLANQLEGGFIQAASWSLVEAVPLGEFGPAAIDWESYPILRFTDIPTVTIKVIDQPDLPPLGAGEATSGPTPAAIANAICDATGLRIRSMPFTPDALRRVALGEP